MPDLIAEKIEKQLGTAQILRGVSFQLQEREILALLGASGSGKTTLLRSVAGLEQPDAGKIEIRGKLVFRCGVADSKFQRSNAVSGWCFNPTRSGRIARFLRMSLRVTRAPSTGGRDTPEGERSFGTAGLGQLADRYAHQLSGGQQQRVALARAMVYNPPVLLLDEPLSNLDAKFREDARAWLREIIKQTETSALYVTHDQTEALAIADRVLLLDRGLIQEEGAPEQIYGAPTNRFSAEFMGSNNRFEGKIGGSCRRTGQVARRRMDTLGTAPCDQEGWRNSHGSHARRAPAFERRCWCRSFEDELHSALYLGERWEYVITMGKLRIRMWAKPRGIGSILGFRFPKQLSGFFSDKLALSCEHGRDRSIRLSPSR